MPVLILMAKACGDDELRQSLIAEITADAPEVVDGWIRECRARGLDPANCDFEISFQEPTGDNDAVQEGCGEPVQVAVGSDVHQEAG